MATKMKVEFKGLREYLRGLRARPDRIKQATKAALYQEAEELMTAAKRLTPVDEGNLRASGHVQLPVESATGVSVTLGFGGPAGAGNVGGEANTADVGYAVYVHEDLTARHPVGQAKYLEQPLTERREDFSERLAAKIRHELAV